MKGSLVPMMENLVIRPERPEDYKATELMAMRSFWNKYGPGCTEHFLIRIIRESADYCPELSRIAELGGRIAGAVYYTRAWLVDGDTRQEIVTFGPLAVEPTLEGNDIGGALMRETIRLARDAGVAAIALMGEPDYYPRFGFRRGADCGITDEHGNTFDALMCMPLCDDPSKIRGRLVESADFEKLNDRQALEELSREFPAYRKVKVQEGFLQIFEQHLGVVESIECDTCFVRYWELLIPAKLSPGLKEKPSAGSDVLFRWNRRGESTVTKVIRNLLES